MRIQTRRRITLGVAAAVALLLIWALSWWWTISHRSALVEALDRVPGDAERVSWTAWADVIDQVGTRGGTTGILDRAYDADLSSTSALVTSAPALDERGLALTDLRWEIFAQASDGAVVVLRPDSAQDWVSKLAQAGWTESGGVYDGSDVVPNLGMSPQLTYVVRAGELLIASDDPDYARKVADQDMLAPPSVMREAAAGLSDPVSAVVFTGDYACGHLAMSQADDFDQTQARMLLARVEGLDPMESFAMGAGGDKRAVTVAMMFDNDAIARHNADARATLATGDAPGQGGSFAERFTLGKVEADGRLVRMRMTALKDQSVLSDLSNGPVLFAGC